MLTQISSGQESSVTMQMVVNKQVAWEWMVFLLIMVMLPMTMENNLIQKSVVCLL